jgi:hypothetical protein
MKLLIKIASFIAASSAIATLLIKEPFVCKKNIHRESFFRKMIKIFKHFHSPMTCRLHKKRGFWQMHPHHLFPFLSK